MRSKPSGGCVLGALRYARNDGRGKPRPYGERAREGTRAAGFAAYLREGRAEGAGDWKSAEHSQEWLCHKGPVKGGQEFAGLSAGFRA